VRRGEEAESAMVMVISTDPGSSDAARRERLYDGEVFAIPPSPAVAALAEFAWEMVCETFGDLDPITAHKELSVEEYVALLAQLKPGFTHHPRSKELIRELVVGLGCDLETTYFDVPKLRTVTPASYLSSGLGYNYQPHRDTWYSAPQCQLNWWAPIRGVSRDSCMAFHPDFWQQPVPNSSDEFDAYEWNKTSRRDAASYITSDPRPHPHVLASAGADIRIVGEAGSLIGFSGAQLHSTVPNHTERARFSLDFRTVNLADVADHVGPANVDGKCTGTTLRDFMNVDTLAALPDELIAEYDEGGSADGVLVFDPTVLEN
jgi:hypothetical protein